MLRPDQLEKLRTHLKSRGALGDYRGKVTILAADVVLLCDLAITAPDVDDALAAAWGELRNECAAKLDRLAAQVARKERKPDVQAMQKFRAPDYFALVDAAGQSPEAQGAAAGAGSGAIGDVAIADTDDAETFQPPRPEVQPARSESPGDDQAGAGEGDDDQAEPKF